MGAYAKAVKDVYNDFKNLAYKIAAKSQVNIP
jgi:hypothetical protein